MLKKIIEDLHWEAKCTWPELAEKLDISYQALRGYRNDTLNPKMETIEKINKLCIKLKTNKSILKDISRYKKQRFGI